MPIRYDLRLDMIGIPMGATLTFVGKPHEECVVVGVNPIRLVYNETVYTMTTLVREVMDTPEHIAPQPTQNLVYNGETLSERRDRFEEYHTHHLG